jgi:hypothetical protein
VPLLVPHPLQLLDHVQQVRFGEPLLPQELRLLVTPGVKVVLDVGRGGIERFLFGLSHERDPDAIVGT